MLIVDRSEITAFENSINKLKGKRQGVAIDNLKEMRKISDEIQEIGVDFIVYGDKKGYVIERKTISDLMGSLISGRLWKQLEGVKDVTKELSDRLNIDVEPVILIEGNEYYYMKMMSKSKLKFNEELWYGLQIGFANMNIKLFRTQSLKGTIKFLNKLNDKLGKNDKKVFVARRKELNGINDERILVLTGINGVGGKKADKLLKEIGSIKDIINLDEEQLKQYLGKKIGKHFYDVIIRR
jgi:ERCC4-type nuclease